MAKFSHVETYQNQNASRQQRLVRPRRRPLSLTPCFSGVFKRQGNKNRFNGFADAGINR
jgi:hypothetical protein